ncbi:MAG: hypothetical protein WC802_01250 [Patescibacteria group bacterium]|jgi:hypothetical protein
MQDSKRLLAITAGIGTLVLAIALLVSLKHPFGNTVAPAGIASPDVAVNSGAELRVPTAEGLAIRQAFISAGYPSADKLSADLSQRIMKAVETNDLRTINEDAPAMGFVAKIVGLTTADNCDHLDLCFLVVTNDLGTRVAYVYDAIPNSLHYDPRTMNAFGGFFGGDKYLVTRLAVKGDVSTETGYALELPTGKAQLIASITFRTSAKNASSTEFHYDGHTLHLTVGKEKPGVADGIPVKNRSLQLVDESGKSTSLTRMIQSDQAEVNPFNSPDTTVQIDYDRTVTYAYPYDPATGYDPLRPGLEYSAKGLYMWIYGGLYYYDPATHTFGLDLSQSP